MYLDSFENNAGLSSHLQSQLSFRWLQMRETLPVSLLYLYNFTFLCLLTQLLHHRRQQKSADCGAIVDKLCATKGENFGQTGQKNSVGTWQHHLL